MPRKKKTPKDGEGETSQSGQHHQVSSSQDVRSQDVRAQQQGFQQPERSYGQPQQGGMGRGGYPQQGRGGYPQQGGGRGGYGGRGGGPTQQGRGGQGYQGQGPPPQGFMQGGPPPYQQQGQGGEPSSMAGGYGRGRGRGRAGRVGVPGPYGSGPPSPTGPSGPFPDLPQAAQQPYQQEQAATAPIQSFAPQFLLPVESGSGTEPVIEAGVGEAVEKMEHVTLQAPPGPDVPGPSEIVAAGTTPLSSKGVRFPLRPGMGKTGTRCIVKANHFFAQLPDKDLHQYDVSITPEVTSRGVNRAVMEQLVKQYKETHLGRRLPAYDGRKSLYTAGPLPFASKEFMINLLDEEDGLGGPR